MRTIFAADYLAEPSLRREVHGGFQVVEQWNSGNQIVFDGKNSELTGPVGPGEHRGLTRCSGATSNPTAASNSTYHRPDPAATGPAETIV